MAPQTRFISFGDNCIPARSVQMLSLSRTMNIGCIGNFFFCHLYSLISLLYYSRSPSAGPNVGKERKKENSLLHRLQLYLQACKTKSIKVKQCDSGWTAHSSWTWSMWQWILRHELSFSLWVGVKLKLKQKSSSATLYLKHQHNMMLSLVCFSLWFYYF